jgi:hypothetical protein
LVTADESPVISKPLFDAIVVEDSQGDGGFPDATCADESNRIETLCQADNLLNQPVASEAGPGRWGRQLSKRYAMKMSGFELL